MLLKFSLGPPEPQLKDFRTRDFGFAATGSKNQSGAFLFSIARSVETWRPGNIESPADQTFERDFASSSSSSIKLLIRSRIRRFSIKIKSASPPKRSLIKSSSWRNQGIHDSMPSNISAFAKRSHCREPHGCFSTSSEAFLSISESKMNSLHGKISTFSMTLFALWSATPNSQSLSISSPQKSIRTGASEVDGQRSTIEPLIDTSPRCST